MITITRKIQIYVNEGDKDRRKENYATLFHWLTVVRKSANMIATHRHVQDNIKDYFYYTENIKHKLADISKDEMGMFTTSTMNTGYQVLSKNFKGEMPMGSLGMLNTVVSSSYKEEKRDYYLGKRSLRSYKENIPIPMPKKMFTNWRVNDKEYDYLFNIYKLPFSTRFGRDRSGNKTILERALSGMYKFSDSSIQYDSRKNKWYLLLVVQFEPKTDKMITGKLANAELDVNFPIKLKILRYEYDIGSKEEFLYHRLSIQRALQQRQINARYSKGGHGRKKKLQSLDYFEKKEKNYVTTKMHQYSAKLVQLAYKNRCETIVLREQKEKEKEALIEHENGEPFLLRNWSYYGLKQMIEYKAKKYGISVEVL